VRQNPHSFGVRPRGLPGFLSRIGQWTGAACFAAVLAVYLQTLAPGLVKGDGGEFQYNLATLGVPHPTGYPLYTLLGWLWTKLLPVGSVAWRINLLSAVCGASAVALVFAIVYRLTRRVLPALAGAAFLAFSPVFWSLSSTTEVYALHSLFVALIIYLLLLWQAAGRRRFRLLLLVAFVLGLSLSHHRTIVLLVPAMVLFVLLEERRSLSPRLWAQQPGRLLRRGLSLLAAFVLGLLPYLHIFVHLLLRDVDLRNIVFDVILGGDFIGFLGLRDDPFYVRWQLPRQHLGTLGLVAATAGLLWLTRTRRRAAVLLCALYVATTLFCLFYRVPDIQDFALPGTLVLAVFAGASAGWLAPRPAAAGDAPPEQTNLARRLCPHARWLLEGGLVVVALLGLRRVDVVRAAVATVAGDVDQRARSQLAYDFPAGATLLADWELSTALRYLTRVDGVKTDVRIVPASLWKERACSDLLRATQGDRSVYVTSEVQITRLPDGYRLDPDPPFLRISQGVSPYLKLDLPIAPSLLLEGVQRDDRLLLLRWLVTGPALDKDYTTFVHFFDATGQPVGQHDKGMGTELTCWYPSSAWPVGTVMQDLFVIPSETAAIRVGLYTLTDSQIEPFGQAAMVDLGPLP